MSFLTQFLAGSGFALVATYYLQQDMATTSNRLAAELERVKIRLQLSDPAAPAGTSRLPLTESIKSRARSPLQITCS